MRALLLLSIAIFGFTAPQQSRAADLKALIDRYLVTYRLPQSDERTDMQARALEEISVAVSKDFGTPAYIADLKYIDAQTHRDPEAIYTIAENLQSACEARPDWQEAWQAYKDTQSLAEDLGVILGVSATGVAVYAAPRLLPEYYALLRAAFPVAGGALGTVTSTHIPKTTRKIICPSDVMRLDLLSQSEEVYENDLFPKAMAAIAKALPTVLAIKNISAEMDALGAAAGGASEVALPEVTIMALVAGPVLGKYVEYDINEYRYREFRKRFLSSVARCEKARATGDQGRVFSCFARLKLRASELAVFLAMERAKRNAEENQNGGQSGDPGETAFHAEAEARYVRAELSGRIPCNMNRAQDPRREIYLRNYQVAKTRFGADYTLPKFMSDLDRGDDQRLAAELASGNTKRSAGYVLLQTSAYLRSFPANEVRDDELEQLQTTIIRVLGGLP